VAGESTALKNKILKLLEEDREFRYAMMGLLGFKEVLDRITKLEERQQKLEERVTRVEESLEKLSRAVVTIGNRFGILAELVFREALTGILRKYFGADARRWSCMDEDGIVYGYRSLIEVDVVVKDDAHILVEVKSRADPSDVIELVRIGELYKKVTGVKPKLAIVAGYVRKKTYEVAVKHGVEIYTYLEE